MDLSLPRVFREFPLLIILVAACSSSGIKGDLARESQSRERILNLKQVAIVGPALGDKVQLLEPSGIAVNKIGEIYISDRSANSIYRLSPDFEFQSAEGGVGATLGTFNRPMGLACDQALNLYVADSGNRRIQILDRKLQYVKTVDSFFDQDDQSSTFTDPEDIRIDREGNFWIADNDRVIKLDPFYDLLLEMSYNAPGNFGIGRASSIDISRADLLAIGDSGNRQILVGTIHGNRVRDFDDVTPSSVAWDNKGALWIAEANSGRLEAYDVYGNILYRHTEASPGYKPSRIAFDLEGRMLVVDSGLRRLYVYEVIRSAR